LVVSDFYSGFLRDLGGLVVVVAAVGFLFSKLTEHQLTKALDKHKHGLDEKLTKLQAEMGRFSDVLSRRNEREFSVTEAAWEHMMVAVGTAQGRLNYGGEVPPPFKNMQEEEALRAIDSSPFSEAQKEELRSPGLSDRTELWGQYNFRQGVQASLEKWVDFKNWLSIRQIFLEPAIFAGFAEIRDELNNVLSHARAYCMPGHTTPVTALAEMNQTVRNDVDKKIDSLGEMIRTRFGFTTDGAS
jgi:hypothetical protein